MLLRCPVLWLSTTPLLPTPRSFFALVLLPAVRDDIRANKRLNYHLYQALKKSLYKPAAFFKGVLIPLCEVRWHIVHCATLAGIASLRLAHPPRFYDRVTYHVVSCRVSVVRVSACVTCPSRSCASLSSSRCVLWVCHASRRRPFG